MRRLTPLAITLVVLVSGIGIAAAGLTFATAVIAGVLLIGAVALLGVSTDRLLWVAVSALVLVISWNGIRVGGGAFGDAFMAIAFAAAITHAVLARRSLPLPPWLLFPAIGFVVASLITVAFPPSPQLVSNSHIQELEQVLVPTVGGGRSSITELIKYELSFMVIPLVIAMAATTRRRSVRLMDLWAFGVLVSALVGIADYGGVHLAPVAIYEKRSAGLTIHPNYLALSCIMAIPFAMLWFGRSRRWSLLAVFALLTLLGGTFASGSRAGTAAAVVAIAGTVVVVPRLRRGFVISLPILGMIAILVLLFTSAGKHLLQQSRLSGSSVNVAGSDYQRSNAARVALQQFHARPIEGFGFSVIADAHDIYLELLAASGIIGLTSFIVFCGGLASAARRAFTGLFPAEAAAASVAMLAWLANGIFDNQLADKYLYVVPGLLFAMSRVSRARAPAAAPIELRGARHPSRLLPVRSQPVE